MYVAGEVHPRTGYLSLVQHSLCIQACYAWQDPYKGSIQTEGKAKRNLEHVTQWWLSKQATSFNHRNRPCATREASEGATAGNHIFAKFPNNRKGLSPFKGFHHLLLLCKQQDLS